MISKFNKIIFLVVIALITISRIFITFAYAEVGYIPPKQLAQESDLIIVGTVTKIESTNETVATDWRNDVPVKYATVSVNETLKGKSSASVIVKFAYDKDLEADVQDTNLEEEEKVLLYLKSNHDDRNSYRVVSGWSGVGRFYEGNFYHQYFEQNFDKYIRDLKEYIKQGKQE